MEIKRDFLILLLITTMLGCVGGQPTKEDIVGEWVRTDGAELIFRSDGTVLGKSLPMNIFLDEKAHNKTFNGIGKWELVKIDSDWRIDISFDVPSFIGIGQQLNFAGDGIFEIYRHGTKLYVTIGDPDDIKHYEFERKK